MSGVENTTTFKAALEAANLDFNAPVKHDVLKDIFTGTGMSGDHFEDLYRVAVPSYAQFLNHLCQPSPGQGGIMCTQEDQKPLHGQEHGRMVCAPRAEKPLENSGLGDLLIKINHVSLIVSDMHKSVEFYKDMLGCKLINRPAMEFDGAWLWMGNVQLHLIQNKEFASIESAHGDCPGTDVNHMSFEVDDIAVVEAKLEKLQIPYERFRAQGHGQVIHQLFLADPDGHFVEICDCGKQTDLVLEPILNTAQGA